MKFRQHLIVVFVSLLLFGFFPAMHGACVLADSSLTREQFFSSYVDAVTKDMTPSASYKDIVLKYTGITKDTPIYQTMQKAVYYGFFPNGRITLPLSKNIAEDQACAIIKTAFPIDVSCEEGAGVTSLRLNTLLSHVQEIQKQQNAIMQLTPAESGYLDDSTLNQIYDILNSGSVGSNDLSGKDTMYKIIQSMVDSVNDPYTIFFPPTEAQQFNEELQGEFEGIGAYVEMTTGMLIITSPIDDSPAQKAGLKAGDRILKIDGHILTTGTDIITAVNRIKGSAGTKVTLLVLRKKKILTFTITRAAVTVKDVSAKIYTGHICYMAIQMFGYGVYDEFVGAMNTVFGTTKCTKYIFDVRNDPGGSLEEVSNILDYFVPTGKPTVVVDSKSGEDSLLSTAIDGIKLTSKKVIVLMNEGSASASEIFAGTIKDYLPHVTLIGDTTYGKGSVQELLQYSDGSMLKYTVAKRYTGKSKTTIDHVGLHPDVEISDNPKTKEDEQLNAALTNN